MKEGANFSQILIHFLEKDRVQLRLEFTQFVQLFISRKTVRCQLVYISGG